ncbi:hypothetical protein CPC735_046740 [Coccidioides posadasii C735 delta SOWgp]|uniref:Uncharacterized protein n=1 Tax=Coccidioides posadasii (strain C735) TaxID=222929 RepID=C5PFH6_COCP7|nr:hypothetical protein CPC735_046740 [Coccidioides posadasii C735 delta SOWgp]EER23304.1 hypothetical protein CPC735_046740 [Coccidioides posadasii C735 delta SOWgp]|eukprot:XP_003065449.1 hypothetical protein CPC735_046740 [Coccidioides posadasii C735 delta SOWgp]
MDYRYTNTRLTRSSSQLLGAIRTPPRAHPLRNVTTMDMENGMRNLFHVSPRYGAVQWHDFQAAAQPVVQVSPIDHPGFVAEQVSCATPKSSRLFPHIAQDIPRLMGPEDVSPTKHEEKLLFREKQSILLDNLSKYHYLYDMEDMATTPRNEVGAPPTVRVPPKFERSRQGRRETASDHIHPSSSTAFSTASESSQLTSQFFSPHYIGQTSATPHAHTPFHGRGIQDFSYGSAGSSSNSRTSTSTYMAAVAERALVRGSQVTGSNFAANITTDPTINHALAMTISDSNQDPFVSQFEPRPHRQTQEFTEEPLPMYEFPRQDSMFHTAYPYYSTFPYYDQGYGMGNYENSHYFQMVQAMMPSSLWDVPITVNPPQSHAANYPLRDALTPVPWPVTPGPHDIQHEQPGKEKEDEPECQQSRKITSIIPSELASGILHPESSPKVAETLTWFASDNRGEEHLRQQILTIAQEDRERREKEQIDKGERPTMNIQAEASNIILGHVLANLQSYLAGDRAEQAENFADWGSVPESAIEPRNGGPASFFNRNIWGGAARSRSENTTKD